MSKDKIYGYGILILTIILFILYTIYVPIQQYFALNPGDMLYDLFSSTAGTLNPLHITPMDGILWPVYLASFMVCFIIAWIGLTMATTPPPEPIDLDDLNLDDDLEEESKDKESS